MSGRPHQGHSCYPDCPSTQEPRVGGKSRSVAGAQSAWSVFKKKFAVVNFRRCILMVCIKSSCFVREKRNSKLYHHLIQEAMWMACI